MISQKNVSTDQTKHPPVVEFQHDLDLLLPPFADLRHHQGLGTGAGLPPATLFDGWGGAATSGWGVFRYGWCSGREFLYVCSRSDVSV